MSMEFDQMYFLYVIAVAYMVAFVLFKFAVPVLKFILLTLVALFLASMYLAITLP